MTARKERKAGKRRTENWLRFESRRRKTSMFSRVTRTSSWTTSTIRFPPEEVIPGWIVGTAGAVRYRLSGATEHKTDVYGYLLTTVSPDGTIRFEFKQVNESDVTESTRKDYKDEFIHGCFSGNASPFVPAGPSVRRSREPTPEADRAALLAEASSPYFSRCKLGTPDAFVKGNLNYKI